MKPLKWLLPASKVCVAAAITLFGLSAVSAAEDPRREDNTLTPNQLASLVREVNQQALVEGVSARRATAEALTAVPKSDGRDPQVVASTYAESAEVSATAESMATAGRVQVTDVKVSIQGVASEGPVTVITLYVARRLKDDQVWEEEEPFAIVEKKIGKLEAGTFVSLDSDAIDNGSIPEELAALEAVPNPADLEAEIGVPEEDTDEPVASEPDAGSEVALQPASAVPPTTRSSELDPLALSATDRRKVKDYA